MTNGRSCALFVFTSLFGFTIGWHVAETDAADLVVLNAKVITVDERQPEAEAFAITGDKFTAVGSNDEIRKLVTEAIEVIDLQRLTVLPGFNDAHIHPSPIHPPLSRLGRVPCDPAHVRSIDELIAALKEKAAVTRKGEWVVGTRYQDTKLGRHPTRYDLDKASTEHPIYIGHSSGHIGAANSLALELAKVTSETADPKGGAFDRDADGHPNGVLRETACGRVRSAGPERPVATTQETVDGYRRCFQQYLEKGITSIQIAGISINSMRTLQAMPVEARPLRIYVMLRNDYLDELVELKEQGLLGDSYFRLGAIKRWYGNSLSGRTCWLYEPYADRPDYYGIPPRDSRDKIFLRVKQIHDAGMQACIHANGDREIDILLDAYEAALKTNPRPDHRHRIEHCSVVNERILQRIKELDIVLATHSYVYEHGDKMEAYGEARWNMMHPNRSAIEMGIPVAGNSDGPVSEPHPMLRIQSMVTRESAEGKTYGEQQKISVEQAIRVWTMGSAYASFEEDIKGSIAPGKLADFIVLRRDPRVVGEDELQSILVERTYLGGKLVYQRLPESEQPAAATLQRLPLKTYAKLGRGPAKENSGIVKSRTQENVFWMQNDSGDEPRIYPVKADGTVYRSQRESTRTGVLIGGAINVDWEDIAVDNDGHLIVADFGNNRNDRRDLVLYYVDEPSALAKTTSVKKKVFFRYPDQPQFPAPRSDFNYDAEALYTLGNTVYILTKHRSDSKTTLYRLDENKPFVTNVLTRVDEFEIDGRVTAADVSPDGKTVVVATYRALWLFDVPDHSDNIFEGRVRWFPFESQQIEAVCFRDEETLILADEATAMLSEISVSSFAEIEGPSATAMIDFDRPAALMQRRPILIAHRGGVVDDASPECSATAIRKAAEQGYDMVELDVRMSADGIPVVFHDRTLQAACGRPESVDEVAAVELIKISYLDNEDRVQTLDQALQQCRNLKLGIMLDLKAGRDAEAFLERINKLLQEHELVQATISFSGSDTARRVLRGVRFTPTDDELQRVRAGENVDLKNRFWFGLPSQIDAMMLTRLKASGALILPAINTFRYEASNHLEAAERDVLRLTEEGADGFQIDSVYGSFFDKLKR